VKRVLARQFEGWRIKRRGGRSDGSTIITEESTRIRVLENNSSRQNGSNFYGAAHLPNFDKRLRAIRPEARSERWLRLGICGRKPPEKRPKKGVASRGIGFRLSTRLSIMERQTLNIPLPLASISPSYRPPAEESEVYRQIRLRHS
jgi:hypothetical protein